jgi:hypothetical protein
MKSAAARATVFRGLGKSRREPIEAEYCLNEGGKCPTIDGSRNDLQVSEKYVINFRPEVRNKGGHSSLPVPDNAIFVLRRISLTTNHATRVYFQARFRIETGPMKDDLAKVSDGSHDAMERAAVPDPGWNAVLRTTWVATEIEGGHPERFAAACRRPM